MNWNELSLKSAGINRKEKNYNETHNTQKGVKKSYTPVNKLENKWKGGKKRKLFVGTENKVFDIFAGSLVSQVKFQIVSLLNKSWTDERK